MAQSAKEKAKARKRDYKRAERITRDTREGKEVSADDLTWYRDEYLPSRKSPGRPSDNVAEVIAQGEGEAPEREAADDADAGGLDPESELEPVAEGSGNPLPDAPGNVETESAIPADLPPPPPVAPPPPPPPRGPRFSVPKPPRTKVDDDDAPKGKAREKWQDKYKAKQQGREASVTFVATTICNVLQAMSDEMKSVGVEPMISVAELYNPWVLTLDEVLPANMELKPEHIAVGGASVLVVQRFMARKKIAAVKDKAKGEADLAKRTAERKAAVEKQQEQERAERERGFDPHLRAHHGAADSSAPMAGAAVPGSALIPSMEVVAQEAPPPPPAPTNGARLSTQELIARDPNFVI